MAHTIRPKIGHKRFIDRERKMSEAIDKDRRDLIRNLKKLAQRYIVIELERYRVTR